MGSDDDYYQDSDDEYAYDYDDENAEIMDAEMAEAEDDVEGDESKDEEDEEYGFDYSTAIEEDLSSLQAKRNKFIVLSDRDILKRQFDAISDVSTVLSISKTEAAILLRHFKWSVSQVNDDWFQDEERVRKSVGLPLSPPENADVEKKGARGEERKGGEKENKGEEASINCGICFDNFPKHSLRVPPCRIHFFCDECWRGYIINAISEGPGCLSLRCPDPPCSIALGETFVLSVLDGTGPGSEAGLEATLETGLCGSEPVSSDRKRESKEKRPIKSALVHPLLPDLNQVPGSGADNSSGSDEGGEGERQIRREAKRKFLKYMLRSYVDNNRNARWCPAPGCEYAVEYSPDSLTYEVTCKCGHNFCFGCCEEAHRPVDCSTVEKWILKNTAESENMNWILANSKACPKCKRPIEKNQGCMHMTCSPPCKFEFCWLCLGAWIEHGETTGGFYACNRFESAKKDGKYVEVERRKEMARNSLEKYTHYYERWDANEQSRKKALESFRCTQASKLEQLSEKQAIPVSQLKFVTDAWLQIVECRRILKWTYAYGYYLPEDEKAKRDFFEYLQGEADAALERLHIMVEKEMEEYVTGEYSSSPFLGPPSSSSAAASSSPPSSTSSHSPALPSTSAGAPPSSSRLPPLGAVPPTPTTPHHFSEFRSRLVGLTSITRTYFENLVNALENGLEDVNNSSVVYSAKPSSDSVAPPSSVLPAPSPGKSAKGGTINASSGPSQGENLNSTAGNNSAPHSAKSSIRSRTQRGGPARGHCSAQTGSGRSSSVQTGYGQTSWGTAAITGTSGTNSVGTTGSRGGLMGRITSTFASATGVSGSSGNRTSGSGAGSSSTVRTPSPSRPSDELLAASMAVDLPEGWYCQQCTLFNQHSSRTCSACLLARP